MEARYTVLVLGISPLRDAESLSGGGQLLRGERRAHAVLEFAQANCGSGPRELAHVCNKASSLLVRSLA